MVVTEKQAATDWLPIPTVGTHERTSLRAFGMTGARPAQGTATTTGDGLVRTHERTSLRAGEDSLRPRTQRTYKYHANVHPLQGVAPCGSQ